MNWLQRCIVEFELTIGDVATSPFNENGQRGAEYRRISCGTRA